MLSQDFLWDFWQREWELGQAQIINSKDIVLKENKRIITECGQLKTDYELWKYAGDLSLW